MPRQSRSSRTLEKAKLRCDGLHSIDPKLSFNGGRSVQSYKKEIDQLEAKVRDYNQALVTADALQTQVNIAEKKLAALSAQFLVDVASKFGKDSLEYEKAGGVRKSDRKRPTRRTKTVTAKTAAI